MGEFASGADQQKVKVYIKSESQSMEKSKKSDSLTSLTKISA